MSSFYGYRGAQGMGVLPLVAAALPLVQGMMQSTPLDTRDPYAQPAPSSPWLPAIAAVGVLAVLGGIYFYVMEKKP